MDLKLDIHLNLGDIPKTSKLTPLHVSPQRMIEYILERKLTHALILYRDIVEYREVRLAIPNEIKLYPLKWIVDPTNELSDLFEEPEAVGICVHSHRGTIDNKTFGLDYSGKQIRDILARLPENFIVCVHTQGVNSYKNISRALSVVKWAVKHPHLKFLIEHSGSYLRKEFYPKITKWEDLDFKNNHAGAFLQDAVGSQSCVQEAILAAEKIHNIFLDSSICAAKNYKSEALSKSNQWAFGSDWPFEVGLCPVDKQERVFKKHFNYSDEDIQNVHKRGIDFLETPVRELFNRHYEL